MTLQVLERDEVHPELGDTDGSGGEFVSRTFFEALFLFADEEAKGELAGDVLEMLFRVRSAKHDTKGHCLIYNHSPLHVSGTFDCKCIFGE